MAKAISLLLCSAAVGRAQALQIGPAPDYQLTAPGVVLLTATITNPRTTATQALRLELWAFARPFELTGPAQSGYRLATLEVPPLAAGASAVVTNQPATYRPPGSGTWSISYLLTEDSGGAFVVRTFQNFPTPLPVAGIMAFYRPVPAPLGGVNIPANLDNLLVDASAAYWRAVDSNRIDTVGLTPGSAPRILTRFVGFPNNVFTMVQDNLYLYVLHGTRDFPAQIIRVTKTSGEQRILAAPAPQMDPLGGAIGIQRTGGTLYFAARADVDPSGNFVPSLMATMPTQGGAITTYGGALPLDSRASATNMSPASFTADFTNIYWIQAWDNTIRHMPLVGGPSSVDLSVSDDARVLSTFTSGPAGAALFWLEGADNARRLKRRLAASVITVVENIRGDRYAIDGERVYFVSALTAQLSTVSIHGGPVTALLPMLDTGVSGDIATDGNAIYWVSTGVNPSTMELNTNIKRLVLGVRGAPLVVQPPANQHVAPGTNLAFTALAASGGLSFVWKRNGVALIPATAGRGPLPSAGDTPARAGSVAANTASSATLTLSDVTAADMGFYSCVITNSAGSIETDAAILTVEGGGPSRIINVSTRGLVQAGAALTPGFVMRGFGSKRLLVRAIGPTLSAFGLDALSDTQMDVLNQQTGGSVVTNDDWGGSAGLADSFTTVGAFPLGTTSKDAAVVANVAVNPNGYSVRITAAGSASSGLALAEVYDADPLTSPARLINVSTLGFAGTGANALTPGFVIGGSAPKRVLIRAVGPGLAPFNIGGALADPQLSLIPLGMSITAARNDDWAGTAALKGAFAGAGAFVLPDTSKDAAVIVRLPPGGYSVVVTGAGGTTGTVLVEVYDLDP